MCPAWLLVVAVVGVAGGAASQCWEHPSCQDLSSEGNMLDCLHLCHSDLLTEESPIFPGEAHLLQTPSLSSSSSLDPADHASLLLPPSSALLLSSSPSDPRQSQAVRVPARRSYSMEHFRWGKPVGRKRRPIKVYTSAGGTGAALEAPADSSDELGFLPSEMRRELQANEVLQEEEAAGVPRQEEEEGPAGGSPPGGPRPAEERRDGSYKMSHFRWSGPPATKRYGGFMKSWDERTQKPLLTLFKNVINKDAATGQE